MEIEEISILESLIINSKNNNIISVVKESDELGFVGTPTKIDKTIIDLPFNYRSSKNIVDFNNKFFSHIGDFVFKNDYFKEIYINASQKINKKTVNYSRELYYITGNNKISKRVFSCTIEKASSGNIIEIWGINFIAAKFEEQCFNSSLTFKNVYYVDSKGIIRRSSQYHSDTLGFILIERLDR